MEKREEEKEGARDVSWKWRRILSQLAKSSAQLSTVNQPPKISDYCMICDAAGGGGSRRVVAGARGEWRQLQGQ